MNVIYDRICADCGTLGRPTSTYCRNCGGLMVDHLCDQCGQALYGPEMSHQPPAERCDDCKAPVYGPERLHGEPRILRDGVFIGDQP